MNLLDQYPWAVSLLKIERAFQRSTTKTEEDVKEQYILLGGRVLALKEAPVKKSKAPEVEPVEPVEVLDPVQPAEEVKESIKTEEDVKTPPVVVKAKKVKAAK